MVEQLRLYHRTSVAAAAAILRDRAMTSKENTAEAFFSTMLDGQAVGYGPAAVEIRIPETLAELEDEFPDGEQHFRVHVAQLAPNHFVRAHQPWQHGTAQERWDGYLDPDTGVLHNLIGARSWEQLLEREAAIVEARTLELHHRPVAETFDLDHLCTLHRRLFGDVYPWAGEIRTVEMTHPLGQSFARPDQIAESLEHISISTEQAGGTARASAEQFSVITAGWYDAMNTTHPFREGNGRTQRVFFSQLAHRSGFDLDWEKVTGAVNDQASQAAHTGYPDQLRQMFATITSQAPASRAIDALRSPHGSEQPNRTDDRRPAHLLRQARSSQDRSR